MLLRAARSPCARLPQRSPTARYGVASQRTTVCNWNQLRVFTTNGGSWKRQDISQVPSPRKPVDVTPQTSRLAAGDAAQKQTSPGTATSEKKVDLLNDTKVVNKEQRKVDWVIMKEMAKYLWPKVGMPSCLKSVRYH